MQAIMPTRLLTRLTALAIIMAGAYAAVLLSLRLEYGSAGFVACSLAVGVCLLSVAAALVTSQILSGALGSALVLLPMLLRMAPPLLLAAVIRFRGQVLVEAGFVYYLIGFYLLMLCVEVPMSLPAGQARRECPPRNRTGGEQNDRSR